MSIASIEGPEGAVIGYVAVKEDITQRKLAEEELRASEERFHRLVESSVPGIVIDRDGVPFVRQSNLCRNIWIWQLERDRRFSVTELVVRSTSGVEPELDRISS